MDQTAVRSAPDARLSTNQKKYTSRHPIECWKSKLRRAATPTGRFTSRQQKAADVTYGGWRRK